MKKHPHKILAVCSGGGHWVQLLRLMPAFQGAPVVYVTVNQAYRTQVTPAPFYTIPDATRWNKFALLVMAFNLLYIIWRERPAVVISTGAAPGYFAIRLGKLLGARTIWVDSIANVEKISLSGKSVGPYTDLWLTQWPHLAQAQGPQFMGAVL